MVIRNVFPSTIQSESQFNKQGKPTPRDVESPGNRTKAQQASTDDIQCSDPLTLSPPSYPEKEMGEQLLTAVCLLFLRNCGGRTGQGQSEVGGERPGVQRSEEIQIGNLQPSMGVGSFKMPQSVKQKEDSSPKGNT